MTLEQVQAIGKALRGTCDYPETKDEIAGVSLEGVDVGSLLADLATHARVEVCCGCGWWFETWELSGDYKCPDCEAEEVKGGGD